MGSQNMRTDTKLTLGLRRLTPDLLLPSDNDFLSPLGPSVPNLASGSTSPKQGRRHQHHTDDFLHSTMKLFLLVTPPAARMQVYSSSPPATPRAASTTTKGLFLLPRSPLAAFESSSSATACSKSQRGISSIRALHQYDSIFSFFCVRLIFERGDM